MTIFTIRDVINSMISMSQETLGTLIKPDMQPRIEKVREYWQDVSLQRVADETHDARRIAPTPGTSAAIVLDPLNPEVNESRTMVIALPHLNGWTRHHYIRTRTAQQLIWPDSRVIVLPNNAFGQQNYDLKHMTQQERRMLEDGNINPFGKQQVRTLEKVAESLRLGELGITGYGFGGLTALSIAANCSKHYIFSHVNADEIPSKNERSSFQLRADRIRSGRLRDQRLSIQESEIPALQSALRFRRLAADMMKFYLKTQSDEGHKMEMVMAGSAQNEITRACDGNRSVKLGHIENSKIFDPDSIDGERLRFASASLVCYTGQGFRGHTSGENVINYALMAGQGLNR